LAALPWVVERFGQPFMGPVAAYALRGVGGLVDEAGGRWIREVNAQPGTARAFARTVRDVISWRGQTRHFLDRAREIRGLPPIALFWGGLDRVIPHAQAVKTVDMLHGTELTSLPDCGHFPHHQRPAELAHALSAFFNKPDAYAVRCRLPELANPRPWWGFAAAACRQLLRRPFLAIADRASPCRT